MIVIETPEAHGPRSSPEFTAIATCIIYSQMTIKSGNKCKYKIFLRTFSNIFLQNLPQQLIKLSDLDKGHIKHGGLL